MSAPWSLRLGWKASLSADKSWKQRERHHLHLGTGPPTLSITLSGRNYLFPFSLVLSAKTDGIWQKVLCSLWACGIFFCPNSCFAWIHRIVSPLPNCSTWYLFRASRAIKPFENKGSQADHKHDASSCRSTRINTNFNWGLKHKLQLRLAATSPLFVDIGHFHFHLGVSLNLLL